MFPGLSSVLCWWCWRVTTSTGRRPPTVQLAHVCTRQHVVMDSNSKSIGSTYLNFNTFYFIKRQTAKKLQCFYYLTWRLVTNIIYNSTVSIISFSQLSLDYGRWLGPYLIPQSFRITISVLFSQLTCVQKKTLILVSVNPDIEVLCISDFRGKKSLSILT